MNKQSVKDIVVGSPREELDNLSNIAYLLYRRNKNQHRRSHWWRHFNIFRRQLSHLCQDLKSVKQVPDDVDLVLNAKAEARVETWVAIYVAKWWSSFSQILAEKRFAALGLTVLAILAKVCSLTGLTKKLEANNEVSHVVAALAKEEHNSRSFVSDDDIGVSVARTAKVSSTPDWLHGDEVAVPSIDQDSRISVENIEQSSEKSKARDTIDDIFNSMESDQRSTRYKETKLKRTKKARKADAIDDIFSKLA